MLRTSLLRRQLMLLLALAFPATAAAAPFGESPSERVAGGTGCLAPTGAPGELSRWAPGGAEVLAATTDGLGAPARVPFGELPGCPRIVSDAGGAAVAAGATKRAVRVAVREPGAAGYGAPVTLAAAERVFDLSVDVSPRGDAVVAWAELAPIKAQMRVRVARRDAGGTFGAPVDIVPWRSTGTGADVLAGIADGGDTVLFVRGARAGQSVWVAAAGAPFGPPAPVSRDLKVLALGVAPDGRALLAGSTGGDVSVMERPAGGVFGAPQRVTDPAATINAREVAVAYGDGERTVVAWHDADTRAVGAAVRDAATGFVPIVIAPPTRADGFTFGVGEAIVGPLPSLQVAVGADGRATVAWPASAGRWPSRSGSGAQVATLAGTTVTERQRLGGALRTADGLSLLTLADGRRALAWTNQVDDREESATRVHHAVEGSAPVGEAAAPRVTIGAPRRAALRPGQELVLPIRCSAACDLRVSVPGRALQPVEYARTHAGTVRVHFRPFQRALAPRRPGPVRVVVDASAPGARAVRRTTGQVRLTRLPALPLPRIEHVRARRLSGGRVEVRWTTSRPADDTLLAVRGSRAKGDDGIVALEALWGTSRRRYRVVLEDASQARWVRVEISELVGRDRRSVSVRLR